MVDYPYNHTIEYYAQYLTLEADDIRYESGYLLTYELVWQVEKEPTSYTYIEFNQETSYKRTNVVDLLPAELDVALIRQVELVAVGKHRLVINLYLKEIPEYLKMDLRT
ncbi:hypothetical protein E2C65_14170 [Listeria monocytogenes]|nr:hypothetical protein [Listeria monocytogenes]EAE3749688.1 hypothetical protein [Listeria monocytogenes]EAE5773679.1 hypothetical protein [Listeria monocytogenes]EAE6181283.1 hypothetical protein [Listeria monocytogenes]